MINKKCLICNAAFRVKNLRKDTAKYCSHKCHSISQLGKPTWMKGRKHTEESKRKASLSHKGQVSGFKGKRHSEATIRQFRISHKGHIVSPETRKLTSESMKGKNLGSTNGQWRGNNATHASVHEWVRRCKGKPKICIDCSITYKERKLHWSNIDHNCHRNLDDYVARCIPCHRKYDKTIKKLSKKLLKVRGK